tara:strand:+ start:7728 stop:8045 length:318 start_codon:yes stop_codon:yes gene_type:complete
MNIEQKDKILSSMIMMLSFGLVFLIFSASDNILSLEGKTIKELIEFIVNKYLDLVLIIYVFICFQVAGYVELKFKQDFITSSLLCILLTPFSLLFIIQNEDDENN